MSQKVTDAQIAEYLQILREAPRRISACTQSVDETRLKTPPAPEEWSATEIMEHVRGSAEARTRMIQQMLALDSPRLLYISPRGWAKKQKYDRLSFAENFKAYQVERSNLIRILKGLSSEQWNRSATFTGKPKSTTVFEVMTTMANHDTEHCQQLETMFPSNKHE